MDTTQYKDVYVFCEQREGAVQSVAVELLGKARELADTLNEKVVAILLGKNITDKAQSLIAAGAENAVHLGHLLKDLLLVALAQAAGDQDLAHQTGLLQPGGLQNVVDGFRSRRIDEAAGVDDHHIGVHQLGFHTVARLLDPIHHPLAVHLVLGAAQGNKTNFSHLIFLFKF